MISDSKKFKILYFSCHEILEYDDLRMFTERGHGVFSLGAYASPDTKGLFRIPKPEFFSATDWKAFNKTGCSLLTRRVSREFASNFDVAIINHYPEWIIDNLEAFGDLPIIYRSLGQSTPQSESKLKSISSRPNIVRYSERERSLTDFLPCDAVIYFGKAIPKQPTWRAGERVITFHNDFEERSTISIPSFEEYKYLSDSLPMDIYGRGNSSLANNCGLVSPDQQESLYRNAAAYLYVYTTPPSYTLSLIEAMSYGTPIIAPSVDFVAKRFPSNEVRYRYEVPELLRNDSRILFNSIEDARQKIINLASNTQLLEELSWNNHSTAQTRFNSNVIAIQWERHISDLLADRRP